MKLFNVVINEFERSGISQAELAKRLGKGADRVSRLLGAPGNWEADTVSDLLFSISGAVIRYEILYPLDNTTTQVNKPELPKACVERSTREFDLAVQAFLPQDIPLSAAFPPEALQRIYGGAGPAGIQEAALAMELLPSQPTQSAR